MPKYLSVYDVAVIGKKVGTKLKLFSTLYFLKFIEKQFYFLFKKPFLRDEKVLPRKYFETVVWFLLFPKWLGIQVKSENITQTSRILLSHIF